MGWLSRLFGGGIEEPETAPSAEDAAAPVVEKPPAIPTERQPTSSDTNQVEASVEEKD